MKSISFLDQLIDHDLKPDYKNKSLSFNQQLVNDLNNLLNTRLFRESKLYYAFSENSNKHKEFNLEGLEHSVYNYGMPDFTYVSFESEESLQQLSLVIRRIIMSNDKRFSYVKVSVVPNNNKQERVLNLKISAEVITDPEPINIELDSKIYCREHGFSFQEHYYG